MVIITIGWAGLILIGSSLSGGGWFVNGFCRQKKRRNRSHGIFFCIFYKAYFLIYSPR